MSQREMASKARKYVLHRIYLVNAVLIFCHLAFALVYAICDMNILFFTNCINITACLLAFVFLKKKNFKGYVHLAFYELYVFMIISIIFLGWEFGFQHYCISFTVAIFFCDFYLNKDRFTSRNSVSMGIFNLFLYCGLRIWTYYFPHIYTVNNTTIIKAIYISNSILTFFFVLFYMLMYTTTVNKLENELRHIADRDPLTGLFNRRKMIQMLGSAIDSKSTPELAIAMIDADFFKNINDTYGHNAGDEVLKTLADILASHNMDTDKFTVCRWGGEEFLIMYIHDYPQNIVIEEFESLRKTIEDVEITYENVKIKMTITIGLAFYQKGNSVEELLHEADSLLYAGKEAGRNQISHTKT